MKEIPDSTSYIYDVIMNSDQKSVVMFWSETCGPCKMMKPSIAKIEAEHPDIVFYGVNTTTPDGMDLAVANGVRSVPTLQLIAKSEVLASLTGAATKDQIEIAIANTLKAR